MWSKSAEPPEGTTGSDHWVAAAYPDRHQAAQDRRLRRHRRQRDDRPADRAEDRPGDAAAVAAARRRGSELELEQLRRGLQLLVHELDFVGGAAEGATGEDSSVVRTSPLPMELNPQVVFERLFGSGSTPEQRAQRMKQSQSILDSLVQELAALRRTLGPTDVQTVNQYTDEIREIERRIQLAAKASGDVPEFDLPPGIPEQFDEHVRLHCGHAGAGVQGRHHPRGDDARRARPDGPHLPVPEERAVPGRRHQRQLPRRLAPPGRPGADSPLRARSTAITCRRWRTWRRS